MSGPHVEKWTYLLVWVQVDGVVDGLKYRTSLTDPQPDAFDLIAEPPFGDLARAVSRTNDPRIKCETYPIVHANKPGEVGPNLSGDEASAKLGLPVWALPKKSEDDMFFVRTGDGTRVLGNGDRVRLTGHLMIENGHPEAGSPFLELHPFDYTSIVSLDNPPRPTPPDCRPLADEVDQLKQEEADLAAELARTDPAPTAGERTIIARKLEILDVKIAKAQAALDACLQQGVPEPRQLLHPSGTAAVVGPLYSIASYDGLPGGNVDPATLRTTVSTNLQLTYPTSPNYSLNYDEQVIENSTNLPLDQVRQITFDPTAGTLTVRSVAHSHGSPNDDLLPQRSAFHARYTFKEVRK